jgi:hypothetical protein
MFFLGRKNQRTFSVCLWGELQPTARLRTLSNDSAAALAKVFASFFKKKRFP